MQRRCCACRRQAEGARAAGLKEMQGRLARQKKGAKDKGRRGQHQHAPAEQILGVGQGAANGRPAVVQARLVIHDRLAPTGLIGGIARHSVLPGRGMVEIPRHGALIPLSLLAVNSNATGAVRADARNSSMILKKNLRDTSKKQEAIFAQFCGSAGTGRASLWHAGPAMARSPTSGNAASDWVAELGERQTLSWGPGELLFRQGDEADCAYLLESGEVEVIV